MVASTRGRARLVGFNNDVEVVRREATLSILDGNTSFYRLGLTAGCQGVQCANGTTCIEGRCEAREVDPRRYPEYTPELVTTLTCESLAKYINTGDGSPMPFSEDASDCPYILCAEGTCLEIPPGARLYRGVCNAVSSFALLVDGTQAGASVAFFRGTGTATDHRFDVNIPIQGRDVLFTGTFLGDRAYGIGTDAMGSVRCDAYAGEPARFCGTFTRNEDGATGRVAFVRAGDVLFGQYADERPTGLDLIGSFDGWATTDGGASFDMFWRNEAFAGVVIESGTATTTITGDSLAGSWTGMSGGQLVTGSFEADASRCRLSTVPKCGMGCGPNRVCVDDVCVGMGMLRFTLEWDAGTDIDLHVRLRRTR